MSDEWAELEELRREVPASTVVLPAEEWVHRHCDAYHAGGREDCPDCQVMIHLYGPMPSPAEIEAADRRLRGLRPVRWGAGEVYTSGEANTYRKARVPSRLRREVLDRDVHTCQDCGATKDLTIDHIQPERFGGATELGNLRTLCRSCNSRKGARF